MWIATWAGSEGVTHSWWFESLMGHFFQNFFGQSFWFAWSWGHTWYTSGTPHVWVFISYLVKMHSSEEAYGWLISLTIRYHPLPFWPLRSFSVHVKLGRSPWPWEWGICGLLSLRCSGPSFLSWLSCCFQLGLLVHRELNSTCLAWGPIYLLPHFNIPQVPLGPAHLMSPLLFPLGFRVNAPV